MCRIFQDKRIKGNKGGYKKNMWDKSSRDKDMLDYLLNLKFHSP